ncbi:MAG: serine/threonine-protein kinase [Myxococcota bacterium]
MSSDQATRPMAESAATGSAVQAPAPVRTGQLVDRYVLLDPLGAGGEGSVYAAFDTELERKIALKLLAQGASSARARREARALAKLDHPNVVAIYDVGTSDAQPYIAMELMAPTSFEAWCRTVTPAEVLGALLGVAEAIGAAHEAGIVHGDIKPSNVLRSLRGDTKLSDFGVARALDDAATGLAGTRAYMAPELFTGTPSGQASDQYAFCLTAWVAVHGHHPIHEGGPETVPTGLEGPTLRTGGDTEDGDGSLVWQAEGVPAPSVAALLRGLDPDPSRRWPSMQALVEALRPPATDPRTRVGAFAIGGSVVAVGGMLLGGALGDPHDDAPPCASARAPMEERWTPERRSAALAPLQSPGFEQVFTSVGAALDDYAQAWSAQSEASCRATNVERVQSDALLDRRGTCLRAALAAFEGAVGVLASSPGAKEHAHRLVAALPDLSACENPPDATGANALPGDPDARAAIEAAYADVDRLQALRIVRSDEAATALWTALEPRVVALDHGPLLVAARLQGSELDKVLGNLEPSVASAKQALADAVRLGRPDDTRQALYLLTVVLGYELAESGRAEPYAALLRPQLDDDALGDSTRAGILGALASFELGRARYTDAVALAERAAEHHRSAHGEDALYGSLLNDLAVSLDFAGLADRSVQTYERAIAVRGAALGPEHPDVAQSLDNMAQALQNAEKLDQALDAAQRAQAMYAVAGPELGVAGINWNTLGNVYAGLGRWREAKAAYEHAVRIMSSAFGPTHPYAAMSMNALAVSWMELGKPDEAVTLYERSMAAEIEARGADHPRLTMTRANYGDVLMAAGRLEDGLGQLRQAYQHGQDSLGPGHLDTVYVAAQLANALYKQARYVEARDLADEALAASDAGPGGRPNDLVALQAVAKHSRRHLAED